MSRIHDRTNGEQSKQLVLSEHESSRLIAILTGEQELNPKLEALLKNSSGGRMAPNLIWKEITS